MNHHFFLILFKYFRALSQYSFDKLKVIFFKNDRRRICAVREMSKSSLFSPPFMPVLVNRRNGAEKGRECGGDDDW